MAGKQIKQEIVLSGEKQYNAAIKEAQRNLKTLQTALKAETAEMGKNATAQQKNEAKVKSLKEQIKEQEKIVQTLREALAAAKEEYGDNGAEVARWEQKLNNARTTLANMKNDLEGVGSGFNTVSTDAAAATVATKSVADALGSIGDAGESVSGAIENIFSGMIDAVTDAVGELWGLISETAAKANNWTDIAGYWGTDAQTIQQYARAVGASANSFEDLQSAVSKIVLGGKGKTITELVGISDVNYINEWDYAMAVMDQLYRMSASGKDMTPIYEQIFGEKKSTKVMDLVNDWKTIQQYLPQFNGNDTGYGMSDQELGTMNDLWVQINAIEEKWNAIKENFAAGFGQVSMDLLVNVEGTLDGIADYLNATDDSGREAALEKIRTNVEEFFTKLADIIRESIGILRDVGEGLQESDDPLTGAIGNILVSLADSLQWMVDNQEAVKGAFEAIFGAWLIAKLAAVAGQLGSILLQIEAVKAFKGVSAATGAAEAAAAGSTAGASWGAAFGSAVMKAVPWLAGLLVFIENAITEQGNDDILDENGQLTESAKEAGFYTDENGEIQNTIMQPQVWDVGPQQEPKTAEETMQEIGGGLDARQRAALESWWDAYRKDPTGDGSDSAWAGVEEAFGENTELLDRMSDAIDDWLTRGGNEDYGRENLLDAVQAAAQAAVEEIVEDVDLDAHTAEEKSAAIQDWWDAYRNATLGTDTWEEEGNAFNWMTEVLGDGFGDVWDRIMQKLDETEDQTSLEDLPLDWYTSLTGGSGADTKNENGITGADLRNFNGLPALMQSAVASGAASGVGNIKVTLDGTTVGRLVAPVVSEIIGGQIVAARNA